MLSLTARAYRSAWRGGKHVNEFRLDDGQGQLTRVASPVRGPEIGRGTRDQPQMPSDAQ
jgi:hypothetical protein